MLLIKNGLVFDGTGAPATIRHIAVKDGQIETLIEADYEAAEELLRIHEAEAERVIDAEGKWVMPGFVDAHTHYDAEVLAAPGLKESVRHGVTTVCIGSCSLSTILSSPEDCADLFSRVEALPHDWVLPLLQEQKKWWDPQGYIDSLEAKPLGPNIASFLGHSDLRTRVMGLGRSVDPDETPTESEFVQMEAILNDALDAGYMGMSVMTNPWDKVGGERYRSSHLPSTYATWGEYRRFNKILRERGRILQGAPNITTKYNVLLFMKESLGLGKRKPLKTTLITVADVKVNPLLAGAVLAATSVCNKFGGDLKWQTIPMPFEVYADGMDLVVFEEFGAGEAALHLADELERNELLKDQSYRRRFRKDYETKFSPRVWHRDFYDATIVAAPDESLVGKTFGELGDARGIHPVDAFLDLVVEYKTELRWKTTIANHRPKQLNKISSHSSVHLSFADSGAHVRNMAFYNFPLYFLRSVKKAQEAGESFMSLEKAVWKLTGELADWYELDAGKLSLAERADIVIVNPGGLNEELDGYHEAPMEGMNGYERMVRRNDDAVVATVIGGQVVYENGTFVEGYGKDRRYGEFLRSGERKKERAGEFSHGTTPEGVAA